MSDSVWNIFPYHSHCVENIKHQISCLKNELECTFTELFGSVTISLYDAIFPYQCIYAGSDDVHLIMECLHFIEVSWKRSERHNLCWPTSNECNTFE